MSERVPDGWKTGNLSDVSEKIWIGLVTTMTKFYVKSGVPLIRNSDITQTGINPSKLIHLENAFANENKSRAVHKGDVVTVHTGDIGTSSVIEDELDGSQGFATLNTRLRQSSFNPYFYSYVLNSEQFKLIAQRVVTGDGRSNLNLKDFEHLPITYPILVNEQKKIASILTSVDEVIETTQKQIGKLQDLKKATMNELLTKGIGHTEFKNSELGRIPKSWEVRRLGELIGSLTGGVSVNSENRTKGAKEMGILKTSCISKGAFFPSEHKTILASEISRVSTPVQRDKIIFSRMNTPNLVGESGYVSEVTEGIYLPDRLWLIDVEDQRVTFMKWLSWLLVSRDVRTQITHIATGTSGSMKNISKPNLLSLTVAVPTLEEQKKIALTIDTIDAKIKNHSQKLSQTQSLKKSLMQDLLTGKVRVQVN